jgi:L-2-hydroxyglutarate oxidase LhgO
MTAGPNAVLALAREGYRRGALRPGDAADTLGYPGLWAFFARYAGLCWDEARRGRSPKRFAAALQRLVPEITADDLLPGDAGVRAQAMAPNGKLIDDFCFADGPASLHVINAPSPGATASLAIGEVIVDRCRAALGWPANSAHRESMAWV